MTGYIGVNGLSKKISKMYIGINGLSKKVNKAYIGVNSVSKLWYTGIDTTDPNTRYESKSLGTWYSTSDVDNFCSTYNHDNNYTGLKLGNYVTITASDSSCTAQWEIAGFDMEYNRTASDGNVYNNGYGICMIPKTVVKKGELGRYDYGAGVYIKAYSHTDYFVSGGFVYDAYSSILGSHIVNRNVLLGSGYKTFTGKTNAYTWTTAYYTLMSVGQCIGTFASHTNKYDDGEANYKLPVMNYENYYMGYSFWFRNMYTNNSLIQDLCYPYVSVEDGTIKNEYSGQAEQFIRPMMYLR